MISTVCKYTPVELFAGFGRDWQVLDALATDFNRADEVVHGNLCGFGKSVVQAALSGEACDLVLVNCCDVMRRACELAGTYAECGFLHLMDLPHTDGPCQVDALAASIKRLKERYEAYSGIRFDLAKCQAVFSSAPVAAGPYVGVMGVRVGRELERLMAESFDVPIRNLTCTGNRNVAMPAEALATSDENAFFQAYAQALLAQLPCRRMHDPTGRRVLLEDPDLLGVIYHSMKFCDFYGPEYVEVKDRASVPVLKIESDFTLQSIEQLRTRIEAFAEAIAPRTKERVMGAGACGAYVAGIDSGSTSTDVVILDDSGAIAATAIIPTGGGAQKSAEACLQLALDRAGIARADVGTVVTTGYGRAYIEAGDDSVTEITCHAKGAHWLCPEARTIIDIGGQDSKVIRLNADGSVANFVMNDKCAAGTGRFLEMMARALQVPLEEMSTMGLACDEDIVISSMCSVFAESEVVSLVAQNKRVADIVCGIDNAVAAKAVSLVRRVGGEETFMMTGGVAQNAGVVAAIERKLGTRLHVPGEAQLCGALGAALVAIE